MYRIESKVDTQSKEFKDNKKSLNKEVNLYRETLAKIQEGGPKKYRDLHKSRDKLLVRERLDKLFDKNTPFLELSALGGRQHLADRRIEAIIEY